MFDDGERLLSLWIKEPPPSYDVRTFGAKGDGVIDDLAAFRSAMAAAEKTGGTVCVPEGVFALSSTLTVPSGVTLEGSGMDVTTLVARGEFANNQAVVECARGATQTTIRDVAVDGDGLAGVGFRIQSGSEGCQVLGCEARSLVQAESATKGIWINGGGSGHTVAGCWVHDLSSNKTGAAKGVILSRVRADEGPSFDVTIRSNRIEHIGDQRDSDGIHVGPGAQHWPQRLNALVEGNLLIRSGKRGIKLLCNGTRVLENEVRHDGDFDPTSHDGRHRFDSAVAVFGSDHVVEGLKFIGTRGTRRHAQCDKGVVEVGTTGREVERVLIRRLDARLSVDPVRSITDGVRTYGRSVTHLAVDSCEMEGVRAAVRLTARVAHGVVSVTNVRLISSAYPRVIRQDAEPMTLIAFGNTIAGMPR